MATIKTQAGKVVLKDGKPSCSCCRICEVGGAIPRSYFLDTSTGIPYDENYPNQRRRQITSQELALYEAGGSVELTFSGSWSATWAVGDIGDLGDPVTTSGSASITVPEQTISLDPFPPSRSANGLFNCGFGDLDFPAGFYTKEFTDPFISFEPSASCSYSIDYGNGTTASGTTFASAPAGFARLNWRTFTSGLAQDLFTDNLIEVGVQSWRELILNLIFYLGPAGIIGHTFTNPSSSPFVMPNIILNSIEKTNNTIVHSGQSGWFGHSDSITERELPYKNTSIGSFDLEVVFTSNAP